jgi:predicted amidohydrolase
VRVAAVQLEPAVGRVAENLARCERLGDEAGRRGAELIVLPEFFTTGMAFRDEIADAALPVDGSAAELLIGLARRHGALVGGSFICRDPDGENRNAFLLVAPDGVADRHDKDLPTMWENAFYVGGDDDGVLSAGDLPVGSALCWELMRSATARRLRGRVDLIVGGSAWWSIPRWPPRAVTDRLEASNARKAAEVVPAMARAVGAPIVHAAHCGAIESPLPWSPFPYRGRYEGATMVCDGHGRVLAGRGPEDGPGVVLAEVEPGRVAPGAEVPDSFWMHRRGAVAAAMWSYQRRHGRRWYRRRARGRPVAAAPASAPTGAHAPVELARSA